ncbi:MAG: lamin tail domain-containing protein [Actinomycetaceae bacterium]|nr:lamin tail domain-containing protein [Actinomycetaceae bacterium]
MRRFRVGVAGLASIGLLALLPVQALAVPEGTENDGDVVVSDTTGNAPANTETNTETETKTDAETGGDEGAGSGSDSGAGSDVSKESPDGTSEESKPGASGDGNSSDTGSGAGAVSAPKAALVLNEIDSSPSDWLEFVNPGSETLDISGYEIRDNSDDHRWQFPEGTMIDPGQYLVVDAKSEGVFFNDKTDEYEPGTFASAIGIGGGDSIRVYDASGAELLDQTMSWTEHAAIAGDEAAATLSRCPDVAGEFRVAPATKGKPNDCKVSSVVINEVESNGDGEDWVELANPTSMSIDISGYTLKDNKDDSLFTIPQGSVIEAGGYLVFEKGDFDFGLGGKDSVELLKDGERVDFYSWTDHASQTYGRCPDMTGAFTNTFAPTKGAANQCKAPMDLVAYPSSGTVSVVDKEPMFLEDSSGLDYADGFLWAVDNDAATFWKLAVQADGSVKFVDGWENGKRARFQKDADNPEAAGPDAEGITIAGDGNVYLAVERDNSDKGTNFNAILQVNPNAEGSDVVASAEWNITSLLPEVSANTGIEAIEWISNADAAGYLFDENTKESYRPENYPNAVAGGVFVVALEDDGKVYAFSLSAEGAVLLGSYDPGVGGAMGLDFDTNTKTLRVLSDNGFDGVMADVEFDGTAEPNVVLYERHPELPNENFEGYARSNACVNGSSFEWFFQDGAKSEALRVLSTPCGDQPGEEPGEESGSGDNTDSEQPGDDAKPGDDTQKPGGDQKPTKPVDKPTKPIDSSKGTLAKTGFDATSVGIVAALLLLAGAGVTASRKL